MEFIKVQASHSKVAPMLQNFVEDCKKCYGLLDAKVFVHAMFKDCSLCLLWKTARPEPLGSRVGLHLTDTLKKYGLVDHSVWVENDEKEEEMA
jgi:hypothetical protein